MADDRTNSVVVKYATKGAKQVRKANESIASSIENVRNKQKNTASEMANDYAEQRAALQSLGSTMRSVWGYVIGSTPGLQKQMGRLSKATKKIAESLGKSVVPAFRAVADLALVAAEKFAALPGPIRGLIGVAFGLLTALVTLGSVMMTVQFAAYGLGTAFGTMLSPILAVMAAVAVLYAVWQANLFGIQGIAKQVFAWLRSQLTAFVGFVRPLWQQFVAGLRKLWQVHGKALMKSFKKIFAQLRAGIVAFVSVTKPIWQTAMRVMAVAVKVYWNLIKTYVLTALDFVLTAVRAGLALLQGDWKKAGKIVANFVKRTAQRVKKLANKVTKLLGGLAKSAVEWAKNMLTKFIAGIEAKVKAFTEKVNELKQKVTDKLGSLAQSAKRWGKDLIGEFISGINSKIAHFQQKIDELKSTVQDAISFDRVENDRMAQRWGSDLVDHFARGMSRKSGQLQSALPSQQPGSFGLQPTSGGGARTNVNVTIEAGAIQMRGGPTARTNAEKTAENVAQAFQQRFGRRS